MSLQRVLVRAIPLSTACLPTLISAGAAAVLLTDATDKRLGDVVETETSVAVSSLDPRMIVVSNIRHGTAGNGGVTAWISIDGGVTWTDHTAAGPFEKADPAAAINSIGPDGKIVVAHNAEAPLRTMRTHEKEGAGGTWIQIDIVSEDQDKPHMTSDNSSYSPRQFDMFCVWVLQPEDPGDQKVRFARRDRFTGQWGPANFIPTPQDQQCRMAPCVQTGRSGAAYCVWDITERPSPGSGVHELSLGFSKLAVGQSVWPTETVIQTINGAGWSSPGGIGNNKSMPSNSFPSLAVDRRSAGADTLYVVWANRGVPSSEPAIEATPTDIYVIKSSNGGATWQAPRRVSETVSDSRDQWHPWVAFDEATGALCVLYLDGATTAGNNTAAYVAVSYNGGGTWKEVKVGDVNWSGNYSLLSGKAYDYIGMAAGGGVAYPAWSDDRLASGAFRAYVSPLLLGGVDEATITPIVGQSCAGTGNPRVRFEVDWSTLVAMDGTDRLTVTPPGGSPQVASAASTGTSHTLVLYDLPCVNGTWTYTIESNKGAAVSRSGTLTKSVTCISCPPPCNPPCELD